jgi:hypothetical protein
MEIEALTMSITDQDINHILAKVLAHHRLELRDVRVRLTDEGLFLSGTYEMQIVNLPFETQWQLAVVQGQLTARLADLRPLGGLAGKAFGAVRSLSQGALPHLLLQTLADTLQQDEAFQVEGDTIRCDLDRLLAGYGLTASTHLKAIHCTTGKLVIESSKN